MMTCGRYFFRDMKNAVPAFRFRFSLVDDSLKLLVESCRNTADFVTLVLIVPYAADVSMENSLTLATQSMCRRTEKELEEELHKRLKPLYDDDCKFMYRML